MNSTKLKHVFDAGDVDFLSRATLASIQKIFQSAAAEDCKRLGVGTKVLGDKGTGWVLARTRYKFERMPVLDDEVTFETWCNPPRGCESMRHVDITDKEGNLIAYGISRWCVLDINTSRLVSCSEIPLDKTQVLDDKNRFGSDFRKLAFDGEWTPVFQEKMRLSKIDVNGHVNNTRFLEFVTDCFSKEEYASLNIKDFQIDFRSQVRLGDTLEMFSAREKGDLWFKGETNGVIAFMAKLTAETL